MSDLPTYTVPLIGGDGSGQTATLTFADLVSIEGPLTPAGDFWLPTTHRLGRAMRHAAKYRPKQFYRHRHQRTAGK